MSGSERCIFIFTVDGKRISTKDCDEVETGERLRDNTPQAACSNARGDPSSYCTETVNEAVLEIVELDVSFPITLTV